MATLPEWDLIFKDFNFKKNYARSASKKVCITGSYAMEGRGGAF